MSPNDADGMAKSEDPDQTAQEQFDLGLHCLPKHICPKTYILVNRLGGLSLPSNSVSRLTDHRYMTEILLLH